MFSAYQIIEKKKYGGKLSKEEISWFITSMMNKTLPDYQVTAMLMAIYFKGMDDKETADLTDAMLYSGKTLTFKEPEIVDKHSTGGIGDKTSFILAPIAAALGIKVPMMAGRGLGFTGGTVDKIECIQGFNTSLSLNQFSEYLFKHNIVLIGQTEEIAPADKIIYGLRDVTATIDSIPLITASIMSKKLAEGANAMVFDIKCGNGAFMSNLKDAKALGKSLKKTANRFKKKCDVLVTYMSQPLGANVGNTLEIIECIEALKGHGQKDLLDLSYILAAHMVVLGGKAKNLNDGLKKVVEVIKNGKALDKFSEMISAQGGDGKVAYDYSKLPIAKNIYQVKANKNCYIKGFDTKGIGFLLVDLGGGRKVKTDIIDFGVGLVFHKKIGDQIKKGETIVSIYHNDNQANIIKETENKLLKNIITFSTKKCPAPKLIMATL